MLTPGNRQEDLPNLLACLAFPLNLAFRHINTLSIWLHLRVSKLIRSHKCSVCCVTVQKVKEALNDDLSNLFQWIHSNGLKLNVNKTKSKSMARREIMTSLLMAKF